MITLCTVAPKNYDEWLDVLLDSVFEYSQHVKNILVARSVQPEDPRKPTTEHEFKGIRIKKFDAVVNFHEHGHALGLHACIDQVQTEYIMFCDPDLFWQSAVDDLYLNLMGKYDLNYIGCSHHSSVANAYSYFPYLMNSLVKVKDLPNENFLKGHLKFRNGCIMSEGLKEGDPGEPADGKYLISSPIPGYWHKLPNIKPNVFFDTGVNLCLWSIEQNWRWLAFQTPDAHHYTTKYFRGNFRINERIPLQKLLYHDVRQDPTIMKSLYKEHREQND